MNLKILGVLFSCNYVLGATIQNPIAPDCINNYTTFYNKYINQSLVDIGENITDISGNECAILCNNQTDYTSFNYFPKNIFSSQSKSLCQLINSTFNETYLINRENVGYYLKSNNDCSIENAKNILIITLISIFIFTLLSCCLYHCCCNKRKRREGYKYLN